MSLLGQRRPVKQEQEGQTKPAAKAKGTDVGAHRWLRNARPG